MLGQDRAQRTSGNDETRVITRIQSDMVHLGGATVSLEFWTLSSVGRATLLHSEGRQFEPVRVYHIAPLAQLVEVSDLESEGSPFESEEGHQFYAS